jgi:hypothetical protein
MEVCADCDSVVKWSRRVFASVTFIEGPVVVQVCLCRPEHEVQGEGGRKFHVRGGSKHVLCGVVADTTGEMKMEVLWREW